MTSSAKNIGYKNIKRWYLEMTEKPSDLVLNFPARISIKRFNGNCEEYRFLNKLIGGDLGWVDRQIMSDEDLMLIIKNPDIQIFVLYYNHEPVGYTELDFRNKQEVILEYFGLGVKARGKGLGKFLLQWTINEVWKHNPTKFKLHTSDQDHPNALPNYLKAGFKVVK